MNNQFGYTDPFAGFGFPLNDPMGPPLHGHPPPPPPPGLVFPPEDLLLEDDENRGTTLEAKDVYWDKFGNWVTKKPELEFTPPPPSTPTSEYALLVRQALVKGNFVPTSLVVQNSHMQAFLREVFTGYEKFAAMFKAKVLTFEAPFHDFFFRWQSYEDHLQNEDDEEIKACIQLLDDVLRPLVKPLLSANRDILESGVAKFEDNWTLFEPGTEIFTVMDDKERIFKTKTMEMTQSSIPIESYDLTVEYVVWNGCQFGWSETKISLNHYSGYKSIGELEAFPVIYHSGREALEARLAKRGMKYADLRGIHYKGYCGPWQYDTWMQETMENERIVIDTPMSGPMSSPVSRPMPGTKKRYRRKAKQPSTTFRPLQSDGFEWVEPGASSDNDSNSDEDESPGHSRKKGSSAPKEKDSGDMLDEDKFRFCTPDLDGFCLRSKRWGTFDVDLVLDITFNPATFKRLVLPHDTKSLILAFVESKMDPENVFDDIVEGKGQGIIFLLSGEPGVGKTLTAEAVSEEMQRPLYTMSAGDLGLDAHDVEEKLQSALDLCAKWDAVLLIDECDVFLEQRAATDLERNKLVAVFLRLLEYYRGCLFLTTNRVHQTDKAFKSRIDLSIHYPNLDAIAKRHIWETFTRRSDDFPQNESSLSDADLDALAQLNLNGREIKNLAKTGRLLAKRQKELLNVEHLQTVMRVQNVQVGQDRFIDVGPRPALFG